MSSKGREWLAPAIVVIATFLTFLPVVQNDFVAWDDDRDLTGNPYWRGLGWTQLVWMFSLHSQHYIPLTWVSFGFDYLVWGLNPVGYHLTNLLLHTASAVVFFFIARRLIELSMPTLQEQLASLDIGAVFAALLFAIHPLRVESVAWAVERKDVLSGFFFLLTILLYLRGSRRWKVVAVYILALFSKSIAVTIAPVLLVLDIYVLKRRALWEKFWLALIAVPFAVASSIGESRAIFEDVPLGVRSLTALFAPGWYAFKTLLPVNLSPLYERHLDFSSDPFVIACAVATVAVAFLVLILGRRWPAVWACGVYTALVLGPTLGIVSTSGHEMMTSADRYTYLSFLSWAVLSGGMLSGFLRVSVKTRREKRRCDLPRLTAAAKAWAMAAMVVLLVFATLTWQQTQIWRNTGTFWRHVLKVDPNSSTAHYNFGRFLALQQGNTTEAIPNGNAR
jgi:protein O-mannosyl-transferase